MGRGQDGSCTEANFRVAGVQWCNHAVLSAKTTSIVNKLNQHICNYTHPKSGKIVPFREQIYVQLMRPLMKVK